MGETESEIENKVTEAEDTKNDTEIIEEEEIVEKCATEDIQEEAQIESIEATNIEKIEDSKEEIMDLAEQTEVKECQESIVTDVVETSEEKLHESNEDNAEASSPQSEEEIVSEPCLDIPEKNIEITKDIQEGEKTIVEEPEQQVEAKASTEEHVVEEIEMKTDGTDEEKSIEQPSESLVIKEEEESLKASVLEKDSVKEVALSCDSALNNVKSEEKLSDTLEAKVVTNNDDVSPLVNVLRQFQESEQLDKNAEEDKDSVELSSAGSESDLGSLESPLDESDGDSSVENEEKLDSALDDDKEEELIKKKDENSTKDGSKVLLQD